MAIAYDGINYFPVGVNFMEENAMEVIEAKYGIKGSAIVLKLLCKIYKEGYFIRWDEEQCLIFANKAGREVQAAEVQGIIEILFIKGILDRNSYLANGILTSANIQKIWMEATKRRKRDLKALPYLLVNDLTQQETEAPEGENVTISPGNVVHDVAVNAKNACNSGQSKVKENKAEENKEFPPLSSPQRGGRRAEGGFCLSPDTGIRLQYNDAQLLGTDGHAKEIKHYRHRGSKLHTQAVGLWEEGNDGMETDCQHLLERHRSQRKIPDSGAKQDEKKVAESVSPLFVVDKKASIQAFDQKRIQ